jgi:flagellar protein FlaJ
MVKKTVKKAEDYHFLKMPAVKLFGKLVDKHAGFFRTLKVSLNEADTKILFRTYLSIIFFLTAFVFIITFLIILVFSLYLGLDIILMLAGLIIVPSFSASLTFLAYCTYPISLAYRRKSDIESNLPFAINHMSAIANSGVPPRVIFKVLSRFKEYGEISREVSKITRNIEIFGMDELTSIKEVASKSPSRPFKDLLQGILTTIQTGGSLKSFLKEESSKAMFDYKIKRNKYIQQLSVYADFYTALLIAAPLVFVIILPILSIMQGSLFGFSMEDLIRIGMVLLAALNVIFLVFLQLTQPKM